jgi:hypothetical protein
MNGMPSSLCADFLSNSHQSTLTILSSGIAMAWWLFPKRSRKYSKKGVVRQ